MAESAEQSLQQSDEPGEKMDHGGTGHRGHKHHHHHHNGWKYFDDKADTWDDSKMGKQMSSEFTAFVRSFDWCRPGIKVLEFGCGTGTNILALSDLTSSAHGVDVAPKMIDRFEKKINDLNMSARYTAQVLTSEDGSELKENAYDLVICPFVLHHVSDHKQAFKRLADATVPGGHLVFGEVEGADAKEEMKKERGVHSWLTVEDIKELCRDNNLKFLRVKKFQGMSDESITMHVIIVAAEKPI
mmetsp:Transcript_8604/g.25860  ORF Transcript_8604/g.25860 Transcript_8604/m.25860 type:complete len:243 (+) Transcript_8604:151-879(+)|eukprot:CAMPEP_0198725946 /NCGR_PEP_ID=MMETSP1475-20131203/3136_1 /TAXON_ID= ORGANISM="Unidentified sp., Strain CCMP1999" /NCGR_SAMPLE_ID=MMETSP1475 /ASSEMBLY_ACC=CAM_ASM_001111 /LENGTH=242 /DNA_ID=CAMNT_0044487805 /DNA_START=134 /DNA_END=862 /DNA_ORIENTATION=-